MIFASPLQSGRLVQRYKRFLADIDLDGGGRITAACPNTGSMLGLTAPGSRVWVSRSDSATRKYPHTWEMIEAGAGKVATLVGINTSLPNTLVAEAITTQRIPELDGYAGLRREVKYGVNSRIDLLLEGGKSGQACYVEIKNVHLLRKRALAEFPDCRTERGVKHLAELSAMAAAGHRAVMLFLVQRADAKRFAIAPDLDPAYATAFKRAQSAGVEMLSYGCRLSPEGIEVARRLDIAEPS